jgi:hypothetical protein
MRRPIEAASPARAHWNAVVGSPTTAEELAEAADRLCIQLRAGLGRWIGIEGYEAVHDRALALVHVEHPVLRSHAFDGGDFLITMNAIRTHGSETVERGLLAWTAAVIELLGRVVGRRMAMRLVEQSIVPSPRGIADSDTEEANDGEQEE